MYLFRWVVTIGRPFICWSHIYKLFKRNNFH